MKSLIDENLAYVNEHRWPPLSYEQAMEEYRKKYLEDEEETGLGSGEESDDDTGKKERRGEHKGTSVKTKTRKEKCKVM